MGLVRIFRYHFTIKIIKNQPNVDNIYRYMDGMGKVSNQWETIKMKLSYCRKSKSTKLRPLVKKS